MEFFTAEKISPSTTKITDITGVAVFLVEGSKKAVLIDTATGAGDLKAYVESLTSKPIEVILTHGHCDHAGGAAGFETVWLHKNDWQPFDFMGNALRIAKKEENHVRLDGGLGNIVYSPEKVFAGKGSEGA